MVGIVAVLDQPRRVAPDLGALLSLVQRITCLNSVFRQLINSKTTAKQFTGGYSRFHFLIFLLPAYLQIPKKNSFDSKI